MTGQVEIKQVNMKLGAATPLPEPVMDWLAKQRDPYQWLLAHTYDGVIWGKLDDAGWQFSNSNLLEADELLELRLFGATKECYLWRDGSQLRFRTITDEAGDKIDCYDEPRILWGTDGEDAENGFTKLWDGSQGMVQSVPIAFTKLQFTGNGRPAKLIMRHYIEKDDDTGLARVTLSRLTSLEENNGS